MNAQPLLLDDTISTLPSEITENIVCRLPLKEVVRSSILSKEWRYKWNKIPKVLFNEDLFDDSTDENQLPIVEQEFERQPNERKKMSRRCKLFYAIYQFLLLHQGPIVDFTLSMRTKDEYDTAYDCFEINQILVHLSRKITVKKLRLKSLCDLPLSIFSFPQLTELYLCCCDIDSSPPNRFISSTFNGFGRLTTLCLEYVNISKKALMDILSSNPLLKSFTLLTGYHECILIFHEDEYKTVDALFHCLPVIEHLTLCVWDIWSLFGGVVPRQLATSLVHLKYLRLERICFLEDAYLQFLILIIRSSPNLEKLKLQVPLNCPVSLISHVIKKNIETIPFTLIFKVAKLATQMLCEDTGHWMNFIEDENYTVPMQEYSDIRLEHLIELEIEDFENKNPDLDFVKLILAKSPVLKKVRLMVYSKDQVLKMLKALLPSPRASPTVEIIGDCVGSVAAGRRYHNLIGMFGSKPIAPIRWCQFGNRTYIHNHEMKPKK
ncbi:F-box/FBD/LRR-repeat protein At1g13570-like [Rutidosis leptorrhynchoides]|uniref:F-box/FBD/LRR-repeat protein At1g13570-like n=1 Tax=Rutidosis leptorrhynchoides TaxID=125765 RepID=UPI003A999768